MNYKKCTEHILQVDMERSVEHALLAIAKASYEQAAPRGLGFDAAYQHEIAQMRMPKETPEEGVDFTQYIKRDLFGKPTMLLMDYINGRDCRTKVWREGARLLGLGEERWYFDKYAFEQREVTAEEFGRGVRRVFAEQFLDGIVG